MLSPATLLTRFIMASDRPAPSADAPTVDAGDANNLAAEGGALVRLLAAAILRRRPTVEPIHRQCARAWRLDADSGDMIRRALVLCADHELNASCFTVRCVASTGAGLRSALIAGLAALSGPRHGGVTERVETLWDAFGRDGRGALRRRDWAGRDTYLPGFGHPLYPAGDPRAAQLMAPILKLDRAAAGLVRAAREEAGEPPSLDLALVALRRHLGLRRGSAFALFALGRAVGWIAHAMEERARGQLIRPRAVYVGPSPLI